MIFQKSTVFFLTLNSSVGFMKRGKIVYYFNGSMPIFQHPENDLKSFRLFTSQLIVNGNAKQSEIIKAFNVTKISVLRWVKKYREEGAQSFFNNRSPKKT
jgi:hypothetical protein